MYYLFSDSKSRRFFKAQVSNMPVQLCTQVSEKLTLPPGSTCAFFSDSRRRLRYVASSLWEIYYSQNYYECVNWFFWLCCLSSLGKWLLSTASVCSVSIGRLKLRLHLHHEDFLKHHDGDPFKGWPTKDAFAFAILSNWYFWWVAQCQRCPTHRREHFLTGSLLVGSWQTFLTLQKCQCNGGLNSK